MVNKPIYKSYEDMNGGPPGMDESWWEAVLSEEEAHPHPSPSRTSAASTQEGKAEAPHPANTQSGVDWEFAMQKFEQDELVHLQVVGYNRGGLLVSGENLQGFVPISHLVRLPVGKTEEEQEQFLASYEGQELRLKIIECDQERGRVVFSERAALTEAGSRNLLLQRLQPGDCVQGTVTNITDFGIFVDLGGVEGLIHVSEISWGRVRHPADVVRYGEQVRVYVIGVEQERSRIALSLKRLKKPALLCAGLDGHDHPEWCRVGVCTQSLTEVLIELAVIGGRRRHDAGEQGEAGDDDGCGEPPPSRSMCPRCRRTEP